MEETLEPYLDAVKAEDKTLVRDVIRVVQSLKKCKTWTINVVAKGYEILCWVNNQEDVDITMEELDLIQQSNPLRVQYAGVRFFSATGKGALRVYVLTQSEPVMIQESTLVRIRKRSRWGGDKN